MKKQILIIIITLITYPLWGQSGIQNDGATIKVDQGASVKIIGANADFTNLQNGKVDLEGTIEVKGDWINNSSANPVFINRNGIGKVQFTGSATQIIGGTNYTQFENLFLNNSFGISLGSITKVDSILSLTNTILDLVQYDLQMGSINNLYGTFGVTNMIVSSNGGFFKFKPVLITYKTLPLGDISGTNEYSRFYFSVNSGTILGNNALISARVVNSKHPNNSSGTHYLNRYWQISSADITNLNTNVYAYYNTADIAGTEATLATGQYNSPFWSQAGGYISTTSNYLRFLGINKFGDFTAGESAVFAVSISIANGAAINEAAENGGQIVVTLNNGTFVASPNVSNWQVNNLPEGVTLGSITYLTSTTVRLNLSGNRTKDYDTNISNLEVMVNSNDVNNLSSGWISDNTGVTITANNDVESLLMSDSGITEGSENGETISLTLSGGTFSNPLNTGNWVLNNLPSGVTYSIVRNSATSVSINLTSNTNVDYDVNIINFEVVVPESDIDDYTTSTLSVNTGVTFTAIVETFTITMSMDAAPINEEGESGEVISISITGDTFEPTLTPANWTLNNLPQGVSWTNTLNRVNDNLVKITLSGNRTIDYDANITNMSVVINANQIVVYNQNAIVSSGVVFTANNDIESLTLSAPTINEGGENGKVITVNLTNGTFYNTLDKTKWTATNLPLGVSIGSVNYVNATQATVVLSGNASVDYDANIDFNLSIDKTQLADVSASISKSGDVTFIANADAESVSITGTINEGAEDGSIITAKLTGGRFNAPLIESYFVISNLPTGVEVDQINYVDSVTVNIVLIGNASVDYDANITNTTLVVDQLAFNKSDANISDNFGVTFVAVDEPALISLSAPEIIESNENGKIITVNLVQDNFAATIDVAKCIVYNLPTGVSVGNYNRVSNTEVQLTLAGKRGIDFDTNIETIYVEVTSSGLTQHNYNVKSDSIVITATNDPENLTILPQNISEKSENGAVVSVVLTGGTFAPSVSAINWTLSNGPAGVSVNSLYRKSSDTVNVTLAGNASVDYDSDMSLNLAIENNQLDDYNGATIIVGGATFKATLEPISMTIKNNGLISINEGFENGAEILVTLENDEFVTTLNQADWLVSNLPLGVTVDTLLRQLNNKDVIIRLKGNSTVDYDQNISNVQVDILGSQFVHQNISLSVSTGVLITANNDPELISFAVTSINERQEDLSTIIVNLSGGTFLGSLDKANWSIVGQPSGVDIGAVSLNSSTQAKITLNGTSNIDFDLDKTGLILTIAPSQVNDHPAIDGNLVASGNVTFHAVVESINYNIPLVNLTEENVNESVVELTLVGDTFNDYALEASNFVLNNAPPGVIIGTLEYIDQTHANVKLSFNRTDFDQNYTNISITINGGEILSGANISTSSFSVNAIIELPFIELADNGLLEGSENLKYITVKLYEDKFKSTINSSNWVVSNLPLGVTVKSLDRIDSVTVNIILQGSRSKDYDNDIINTTVTIQATELVTGLTNVSTSSGVIFVAIDDIETLSLSPLIISEGTEDGKIITINLTGGTFISALKPETWLFENLPVGIAVTNVVLVNSTKVTITLSGNRSSDYDVDITNFKVTIPSTDISDIQIGNVQVSTGISFIANIESLKTSVNEITEVNLNGGNIILSLINDSFIDPTLNITSFTLPEAVNGLSIGSVSYINDTAASVQLVFDNHDFDTDLTMAIEINTSELFGVLNLVSENIALIANNDSETLSMSADLDGIFEGDESGEIITIVASGGTFSNPITTNNWEVFGLPQGITYTISRISLHEAQIMLLTNSTVDYDSDLTDFSVLIPSNNVLDYSGDNFVLSGSIIFKAYNELLNITGTLDESTLNGKSVSLTLTNDKFVDATLNPLNFKLNNAPIGLTISSVNYISETQASIILAFDNTDFDLDINDFSITVLSEEVRRMIDIISNVISIGSVIELENISIAHSGLTEENLNGAVISLKTSYVKFKDANLSTSNFVLNNAPIGCSISGITYLTDSTANILVNFDNSDFDDDKAITITVLSSEITVNSSITSNNLTIHATADAEIITLVSNRDVIEQSENGAQITVKLEGGDFVKVPVFNNWIVLDLPSGVVADNFTLLNDTTAKFQLTGNRNQDFDTDLNIDLTIPASDIIETSTSITSAIGFKIFALNDPEVITMTDDGEILEGIENGEKITVNITGGTFATNINIDAVSITNLPTGVSLGTLTRVSATQITLQLLGNRTVDYDENIDAILRIQSNYFADYTEESYFVYTGVVFIGTYELEDRVLDILVDDINEDNLSGLIVPLTITHDQFIDNNLSKTSFILNNAPIGTSIESVSYVNATECKLTLAYDKTDFDIDITNFNIEIVSSELSSGVNLISANKTITAIDESPRIIISHPGLNELNLNGAQVAVTIKYDSFLDGTVLLNAITLNNAPAGLTISSFSYLTANSGIVILSFDGTDFDTDISNFSISVSASELISNTQLTSNNLTLIAADENGSLIASVTEQATETNLNNFKIELNLVGETFIDNSLKTSSFQLSNTPKGVSVSSVSYVSNKQATLTLAFQGDDFDSDFKMLVQINGLELTGNKILISNSVLIQAVKDNEFITLATAEQIIEGHEDGEIVSVNITGGTFDDALNINLWRLQNLPMGIYVDTIKLVSLTQVDMRLKVQTIIDYDKNKEATLFINENQINDYSGIDLQASNKIVFYAIDEQPEVKISNPNLSENNLNKQVINLTLAEMQFLTSNLKITDFTLVNSPSGLSIAEVIYNSEKSAQLILLFDSTDFDTDKSMSVVVNESTLSIGVSKESNPLPIIAINDDEVFTMSDDGKILEGQENGEVIKLFLKGGTFINNLELTGWVFNNLPEGVKVGFLNQLSDSIIELILSGNSSIDYDANLTQFEVGIPQTAFHDYSGDLVLVKGGVTFIALLENSGLEAIHYGLTENNLNGAIINLDLTNAIFVTNDLPLTAITLNSAPNGLSVKNITVVSDTVALIELGFIGIDFDEDYTNFSITISAEVLWPNSFVTSNSLGIKAIIEPIMTVDFDGEILEGYESGEILTISLPSGDFIENISIDSITFSNYPEGLSFGNLFRISDKLISIEIINNRAIDYDSDIEIDNAAIKGGAFKSYSGPSILAATPIIFTAFNEKLTISSASELYEGSLDGAVINLLLTDDTFLDNSIDLSNITLFNVPIGMVMESVTYINDTLVNLVVSFDGTDFIGNITNFYIGISGTELHSNTELFSNELLIYDGLGIRDNNWNINIYSTNKNVYISIAEILRKWESSSVLIYNALGKVVYSSDLQKAKINVINLDVISGYYLVKVKIDGNIFIDKVFISDK